jgi:hypothetical protein
MFTAHKFVLTTIPSRLTTNHSTFQLNTCDHSPYVTSSLKRGWVCCLQLLLVLASSFSGPSPTGFMTISYCLRFETYQTWRGRFPHLYPPGTRWPGYTAMRINSYFSSWQLSCFKACYGFGSSLQYHMRSRRANCNTEINRSKSPSSRDGRGNMKTGKG